MDKIFTEHEWDDDASGGAGATNFSFVKTKAPKKDRKKQKKTEQSVESSEPGRFVRAPVATEETEVPSKKSRKRAAAASTQELHSKNQNGKLKKSKGGQPNQVESQKVPANNGTSKQNGSVVPPTDFRSKLVESLKGSRFRFLNEQLYKTTGEEAKKLFLQDPAAFQAYHEGYRHQIVQWSMNPLDRIVKSIKKLPENYIVADFGCGEARLAESVPHKVYSLDLVAANSSVIACDMANTPLETNSINVVVFCLSLMGTNLRDFLLEANRIMKTGALLKIAEVSSRFDDVKEFVDNVQKCGFLVENKDLNHKLFYFFHFKKVRTVDKSSFKGKHFSLKPCLYKKR
ncbi:ribosomal RNA-processing protein 8 [Culex pipiens pallens]|uniref:ribosomal RNA-processing protein 8 n=1 Tax=Culex pipiens pallens TaxID=42434 RepID=UPI001954F257|nr:ribosomal RNA-processing protein 8 [Culex pipiens pallens]